jgi:transcription termination factor Rho
MDSKPLEPRDDAEHNPPRPVIEEAFEEIAAVRAEAEDRPTERDMDFEAGDEPHPGPLADEPPQSEPFIDADLGGEQPYEGGGNYGQQQQQSSRRRRRRRRGGRHGGGQQGRAPGGQPSQQYRQGPQNGQYQQQSGQRRQQSGGQRPQGPPQQRGPEQVIPVIGVLELHPKGYGFLRDAKAGYISQESDAFVSSSLIEKYRLREGVIVTGEGTVGHRGQGPRLRSVDTIDGRTPENYLNVKNFDELTPITPFQQIKLETGPTPITMRVMDLLTPIGKGQRALLVAPPRTGKTMLLQEIADAVSKNYPDIYLMVLLIDERPEEVTEMKRRVRGEVIASSLDRELESHIRVSQLVFERAKRMTEEGRDVFVLLDSITRTARAFNKWSNSGRTGTGGLDIRAMDIPKKMFGMARQFEEGGSLTVVGTALIDTGSRMDEAIFQEFKGTGNMEMVLSRDLADRRIWPAIDITKSGTRREEKILPPDVLEGVTMLRRSLISMSPVEAMEQLIKTLAKYPSNAEFLARIKAVL